MLFSTTVLSRVQHQRAHSNRLSYRSAHRDLVEGSLLSGHDLTVQGRSGQSKMENIGGR